LDKIEGTVQPGTTQPGTQPTTDPPNILNRHLRQRLIIVVLKLKAASLFFLGETVRQLGQSLGFSQAN
jgi:hypothetical protein